MLREEHVAQAQSQFRRRFWHGRQGLINHPFRYNDVAKQPTVFRVIDIHIPGKFAQFPDAMQENAGEQQTGIIVQCKF